MRFRFEWDEQKARANTGKHGVSFEEAMSVFLDPLAATIFDRDSSVGEKRWITIGTGESRLLLVVHTSMELADDETIIRIISARRPTRREAKQYEEG